MDLGGSETSGVCLDCRGFAIAFSKARGRGINSCSFGVFFLCIFQDLESRVVGSHVEFFSGFA